MTALAGPLLSARSLDEAYEYLTLTPGACGGAAEPGPELAVTELGAGRYRLDFPCSHCDRPRSETVQLTEDRSVPGAEFAYARSGRPSALLDGGGWVVVAHRYYRAALLILDQLAGRAPDDETAANLAIFLTRAAAAADEALTALPPGAAELPDEQVGTELARELREQRPALFTRELLEIGPLRCREQLTDLMARYQDRLACPGDRLERLAGEALPYGSRPLDGPLPARTYWEALRHSATGACRCGARTVHTRQSSLLVDGHLLTRLFGPCAGCGRPREFLYRNLVDPAAELSMAHAWRVVDDQPSQLFDPAAFVAISRELGDEAAAGLAADDATADRLGQWLAVRHRLWLSAEAAQEALAALPPAAQGIDPASIRHPLGARQLASDPESLRRDRLEHHTDQTRRALAEFLERCPRPADTDDDEAAADEAVDNGAADDEAAADEAVDNGAGRQPTRIVGQPSGLGAGPSDVGGQS